MKGKFIYSLLAAALMVTASGSFVSCKDYESDDIQRLDYSMNYLDKNLQDKVNSVNERIDSLNDLLGQYGGLDPNDPNSAFNAINKKITDLQDAINDPNSGLEKANDRLDELERNSKNSEGKTWQEAIEDLKQDISNANCNCDLASISARIDSLRDVSKTHATKEELETVKGMINNNPGFEDDLTWKTDIHRLDSLIQNLPKDDTGWKTLCDSLKGVTKNIQNDMLAVVSKANHADSLAHVADSIAKKAETDAGTAATAAAQAAQKAKEAKDHADSLYNVANNKIDGVNLHLNALEDVTFDMVKSLVTNVIVQSTYSPVVGELALPLDIQANVVGAYFGSNSEEFEFPTNNPQYFATGWQPTLTAEDMPAASKQVTIPEGTLITADGAEGNAGSMYVTVNPSYINIDNVNFSLINSQGTPYMSGLEANTTDKILTWGYTRAAGNNFYEIPITIDKSNLDKFKPGIDASKVKTAVKNLLNERTETKKNLKALARESAKFVYDNMNGKLPRLALATEFDTYTGEKNADGSYVKTTGSNVSEMNIMAVSVRPVGFGTLAVINDVQTVPGLERAEERVENFINNLFKKIGTIEIGNGQYTEVDSVDSVGTINLVGGTYKEKVYYTYTVPVYDHHGNKTGEETRHDSTIVDLTSSIESVLSVVQDGVNHKLNNIDTSLNTFNSNIDGINSLIHSVQGGIDISDQLDGVRTDLITSLTNFLDRQNNRFRYWFNRAKNNALQPVMLFNDSKGIHRLTAASHGTDYTGSTIKLVPTSWTLELFAPAYKKYVKVYKGSDVRYSEVFDGLDKNYSEIEVSGLTKGVWTIVYEAVDYQGKVSARKYYLNVQ